MLITYIASVSICTNTHLHMLAVSHFGKLVLQLQYLCLQVLLFRNELRFLLCRR